MKMVSWRTKTTRYILYLFSFKMGKFRAVRIWSSSWQWTTFRPNSAPAAPRSLRRTSSFVTTWGLRCTPGLWWKWRPFAFEGTLVFNLYLLSISQSILKKFCNGLVCFELENYLATRLSNCGWLNVWFGFTFLVSLGSFLHFFSIHEFLLLQDSQPIANFISHSIIFVFPSFD